MGAGKSSTGRHLAHKSGAAFIDSDQCLEKRCGMSITDIFLMHGEPYFRQVESRLLLELAQDPVKKVISLGGGVVLSPANRDILKTGHWVFLAATPATILKRIGPTQHRPLLGKSISREDIEKLLQVRLPLYRQAPLRVETDGLSPLAVAEKIAGLVK